jgi:3-hydroxybutyryl-CoA dehydrogenase
MTTIATVGVLGGGLMGSGIAQVAAQNGFTTIVREIDQASAQRARTNIEKSLAKAIEKGKLTAEARDATMGRLSFTTVVADLALADIVIEAVIEDLDLKNGMWKELNGLCPAHTIFASNTSSLTIAAMAAVSGRGDRMVGLHFFNPVPVMKLVEVVKTVTTSDETFARAFEFASRRK